MRLILTALLAIYGAEPLSQALLNSPLAPDILRLSHSAGILAVFGTPNFMLQMLFTLCCYEVAGLLEGWLLCGAVEISSSCANSREARSFPHGAMSQSVQAKTAGVATPVNLKKPE